MSLIVSEEKIGNFISISAEGEVDLYTSPDLRKLLLKAMKSKSDVAVNLAGVTYMDSSGVATLVEALKSARDKEKVFALVAPSKAVVKVLELARLDSVFDIRDKL